MAQKTVPKSLRLTYFKNWESCSIISKNNYSKLFFFEYNIYMYLKFLCNGKHFTLNKIKIKKQINSFRIYVSIIKQTLPPYLLKKKIETISNPLYHEKNNIIQNLQTYCNKLSLNFNIQLFIFFPTPKILQKKKQFYIVQKKLKKYRFMNNQYEIIRIICMSLWTQSVVFLNNYLIKNLKNNNKQLYYLRSFEKILNKLFDKFPNFIGYKIQWKGRLNGKERAKKIVFNLGIIPLNTIKYNIQYDIQEVITPAGVCSLRVWLLFNSKNLNVISK